MLQVANTKEMKETANLLEKKNESETQGRRPVRSRAGMEGGDSRDQGSTASGLSAKESEAHTSVIQPLVASTHPQSTQQQQPQSVPVGPASKATKPRKVKYMLFVICYLLSNAMCHYCCLHYDLSFVVMFVSYLYSIAVVVLFVHVLFFFLFMALVVMFVQICLPSYSQYQHSSKEYCRAPGVGTWQYSLFSCEFIVSKCPNNKKFSSSNCQ